MIRTTLVALAATAALIAPVAGANAHVATGTAAERGSSIAGTWKGGVFGDNGADAGYTAKVTLKKNAKGRWAGRVSYPGICSGTWSFTGKAGGAFTFKERITKDPAGGATCVSPVRAKVKREGAKLRVTWTEPKSGDTGTMLAKKV